MSLKIPYRTCKTSKKYIYTKKYRQNYIQLYKKLIKKIVFAFLAGK